MNEPAPLQAVSRPDLIVRPRGGLRLAVRQSPPGQETVALRILLPGGARAEQVPGQASLCGRMLSEGTRGDDYAALAERFESRGMAASTFGGLDALAVVVDAIATDWRSMLAWSAELITDSVFPEDRCAWLKDQALAELHSLGDQPDVVTGWAFLDQLYHPHPAGRPHQGTALSVAELEREHLVSFHQRAQRGGLVLAVAGAVDPEAVVAEVDRLFAHLRGDGRPAAEPPIVGRGEERITLATAASGQSHLYLGHLTVPLEHPDRAALEVASVVLGAGSGLTGRFPTRIREQEGLAYSAHASAVAGAGFEPGRFFVYVATSQATVDQAERSAREELERLIRDGLLEEEVRDARAYLLGREAFRRETSRQWADLLADSLLHDLPLYREDSRRAELLALDRPAVEGAIRRHLHTDALKVTVGSPQG